MDKIYLKFNSLYIKWILNSILLDNVWSLYILDYINISFKCLLNKVPIGSLRRILKILEFNLSRDKSIGLKTYCFLNKLTKPMVTKTIFEKRLGRASYPVIKINWVEYSNYRLKNFGVVNSIKQELSDKALAFLIWCNKNHIYPINRTSYNFFLLLHKYDINVDTYLRSWYGVCSSYPLVYNKKIVPLLIKEKYPYNRVLSIYDKLAVCWNNQALHNTKLRLIYDSIEINIRACLIQDRHVILFDMNDRSGINLSRLCHSLSVKICCRWAI